MTKYAEQEATITENDGEMLAAGLCLEIWKVRGDVIALAGVNEASVTTMTNLS